MKKTLSIILSLLMIISTFFAIPFETFAATVTSGKCGENVYYEFDSSTGTLTVRGIGSMNDYSHDYSGVVSPFFYHTEIINVTIESGVTNIGNAAFNGCSGIKNISFNSGLKSIGDYAFERCSGLKNIDIPNGVITIGEDAFASCTDMTNIIIPESVTSIGAGAFYCCSSLKNITIPNGVTSIENLTFFNVLLWKMLF